MFSLKTQRSLACITSTRSSATFRGPSTRGQTLARLLGVWLRAKGVHILKYPLMSMKKLCTAFRPQFQKARCCLLGQPSLKHPRLKCLLLKVNCSLLMLRPLDRPRNPIRTLPVLIRVTDASLAFLAQALVRPSVAQTPTWRKETLMLSGGLVWRSEPEFKFAVMMPTQGLLCSGSSKQQSVWPL